MTWADAWRAVLDDAGGPQRRARGVGIHRAGRTGDVRVAAGRLTGRVQGSRATPFLVEVAVGALGDEEWSVVADLIAGQARHSARLLAGEEPRGLEAEAAAAGAALLPTAGDVDVSCGCGDREPVCLHAAALWEAFAEHLEASPFPLLRLRGRGRARLLREVAGRRGRRGADEVRGIPLDALDAAHWTRARARVEALPLPSAKEPRRPAPSLAALPEPPGWEGSVGAWQLLGPLVAAAGSRARALLAADDGAPGRVTERG